VVLGNGVHGRSEGPSGLRKGCGNNPGGQINHSINVALYRLQAVAWAVPHSSLIPCSLVHREVGFVQGIPCGAATGRDCWQCVYCIAPDMHLHKVSEAVVTAIMRVCDM
jgi:hypothetical protein